MTIISFNFHYNCSVGCNQPYFADEKWSSEYSQWFFFSPQLINVRVQVLNPSFSDSVSSSHSSVLQRPNEEQLRKAIFLFLCLFSILSPNIAHTMEWNSNEIEVNSFLLEFLSPWSCSQFLGKPWFNFYILSLTLTSSQILFPRILSHPMWWITWFASRQKTTDSNHTVIIYSKIL